MIDVNKDSLVSLHDVGRQFPMPDGQPRSLKAVMAWVKRGIKARRHCPPILLEAVRVGSGWFTTAEAIGEFVRATTVQSIEARPQPTRAGRGNTLARARLKARGVCK